MRKLFADRSPELSEREKQHAAIARAAAEECVVLLKNDGTLPLEGCGRIALFGMGARHTVKGGTGSGDVYARSIISVEQGLRAAGFRITTDAWLDRNEAHRTAQNQAYWAHVREEAANTGLSEIAVSFSDPFLEPEPLPVVEADLNGADTAIYVIARNSGEGADRRNIRGDYQLYAQELQSLRLLGRCCRRLVCVLNIGGVMDACELEEIEGLGAIVLMSQLGNQGGSVLADVLSGRVNPSGRLTDTWARRYADYPSSQGFGSNDDNTDDEYYTEGIYVGYRCFDSFGIRPLYPFGYGLSYTGFSLTPGRITLEDASVKAEVTVTNTGSRFAGKETVQLYAAAPAGRLDKPAKELRAFAKTELLAPGQSQTLTLCFGAAELASYSTGDACWLLEPGDYRILIGQNAASTVCAAKLRVPEQIITQRGKNVFACDSLPGELHAPLQQVPEEDVPVLTLDPAKVPCRQVIYDSAQPRGDEAETLAAQFSTRELAELTVGTLRLQGSSALGDSSYTVPGAAGDTCAVRGVRPIIMADGPAGLRLKQSFRVDENGNLLPDDSEDGDCCYQYCTAIPIGWAMAQSWNPALVRGLGEMVGREMAHFGIDLWLAPALNIHRNPLCGRNFEYYSEDPFVSGVFAAAMTRGVMTHPGKSTVIKHFAANNQENNRYFTNSHVSERALREIYLKGFEIALRNTKPEAVMSSYNLLNGIHTANHRALLTMVLRDEWGFGGFVMTDWFTSQDVPFFTGGKPHVYPIASSVGCIAAGNDLQMPGCTQNIEDIVEAVEEDKAIDGFRITRAELERCAANILRTALKLER